jgi:hypothetical protein
VCDVVCECVQVCARACVHVCVCLCVLMCACAVSLRALARRRERETLIERVRHYESNKIRASRSAYFTNCYCGRQLWHFLGDKAAIVMIRVCRRSNSSHCVQLFSILHLLGIR